jgi:hypothetical protein
MADKEKKSKTVRKWKKLKKAMKKASKTDLKVDRSDIPPSSPGSA